MRPRLTAALLAPKGGAFPLGNAYANPLLDPIPGRREAPPPRSRRATAGARCRVAPELHTRLRILAARHGKPVRALVEAAVDAYLSANGENCPCLQGRPAGNTGARGSSCCLGLS